MAKVNQTKNRTRKPSYASLQYQHENESTSRDEHRTCTLWYNAKTGTIHGVGWEHKPIYPQVHPPAAYHMVYLDFDSKGAMPELVSKRKNKQLPKGLVKVLKTIREFRKKTTSRKHLIPGYY